MENKEIQELAPKSGKELLIERLKIQRPDLDVDDEESFYGAINADYDGYEAGENEKKQMRDSLDKMLEVFDKHPEAAALYVDLARGGKSVLEYLIERYGDDFKAILEDKDPAKIAKIAQAENKYRSRILSEEELKKESETNLLSSLDLLDEAAAEAGLSDEEKDAVFESFASMIDDAIKNKVSKDTWVMIIKGNQHDKDVASAIEEGEVRGRNTRIAEKVRKPAERVPPTLGGQAPAVQRRRLGGILDHLSEKDWYEKGKENG